MLRHYTVTGFWPFPIDMLRRDDACAASEADQLLIDRLSKDHTDDGFGLSEPVSVNLVMEAGEPSRGYPNVGATRSSHAGNPSAAGRSQAFPSWMNWKPSGTSRNRSKPCVTIRS